ncbi:MAG: hypothetical protein M1469_12425 [Bacteroidetes bacterium]|nr:hypothetical protein [Bacteroidota bacterium]
MNLLSLFFGLLFLVSPPAQNDGLRYLENAIAKFNGIKDYVVDVKVHLDLEAVKAPDMEAKVYFKEPDKVKIDSKGLFFMPKDVGVINPRKFDPAKFLIQVIDTLTYEGDPAVRLSLTPKKDESGNHDIVLTIDKKDWLIREIGTAPSPGRTASAKITYGMFGGFMMPVKVDVKLDMGNVNGQAREFGGRRMRMNEMKGTVEVYYSNYKINTGLSDKIFERRNEE